MTSVATAHGVMLRRAGPDDAPAIAALHRQTRMHGPDLHTPEEDLHFFAERMLPEQTVWVAEQDGVLVGYAASTPGWLNHLFVAPEAQGRGLGFVLLNAACPAGELRLWTFQRNVGARRFYEGLGFVAERYTDGDNEEGEPDVCYVRRS